jgi:DHA2 family multidrug resistance protein
LNESLDRLNPSVQQFITQGQNFFLQHTGNLPQARESALGVMAQVRDQQASSLAYFDVFWFLAAVSAALVLLVLLMRRSVAEKGAHVGGE